MQKVVPNHNLLLIWFILWETQGAVPFRGLLGIGVWVRREGVLMLSVMMLKAVLYQGTLNISFMIATDREKLVTNDHTTQMIFKKR